MKNWIKATSIVGGLCGFAWIMGRAVTSDHTAFYILENLLGLAALAFFFSCVIFCFCWVISSFIEIFEGTDQ